MDLLERPKRIRGLATRKIKRSQCGMTLVEISISISILVTVLLGFCQALMGSMKASRTNRETAVASHAARQMMETLRASDFETLFAANNSVAGDDPGGVPARLAAFDVPGLNARAGDADGLCGQIIWPEQVVGGVSALRENIQNAQLSLPMDLNGDAVIDGLDHAGDYKVLPVLVRVDWRGTSTNGRIEFKTILSDF